jgi:hypothetical protein
VALTIVRALEGELLRFDDYLGQDLVGVSDPFARLHIVVRRLMEGMARSRRVSEALRHAYVASTVVASAEAEAIRALTTAVFVHRMSDGVVTYLHLHTATLVIDVWTSEMLALVQGRRTSVEMHRLIGHGNRSGRTGVPARLI